MDKYHVAPIVPTEEMLLRAGKSPTGVSARGGIDWLGKMLPKYYAAMMTAAPNLPPGLLYSLGDGTVQEVPRGLYFTDGAGRLIDLSHKATVTATGAATAGLLAEAANATDAIVAPQNTAAQSMLALIGKRYVWLVTSGPDGEFSKIAIGMEHLKRVSVEAVMGDPDDDSDEADRMRHRLADPDEWGGCFWSIGWDFEDGYLRVQRVTDMSAIVGVPQAPSLPETR